MEIKRRQFVKTLGLIAGAAPFVKSELFSRDLVQTEGGALSSAPVPPYGKDAKNEDFWGWIHSCYTVNPNILNLNNGGVSPQPKMVQDAFEKYYELCNEGPSYYMWRIVDSGREPMRQRLAQLAGCSPEEISFNRNTTEALDTVIFGMPMEKGDEVILTKQDYPNVINAWKQREKREGIVIKWISLRMPNDNEEEIVSAFASAFTSKTKVVNLTHMINWNGQLLPVKKIAQKAHENGIEVIVDGAHTFAHLDYKIPDLECDYFGTSLHKWLCAPFGTGALYVRKDKIKKIWPLYPNAEPQSDDIRKFEALGSRSMAAEQAIGDAINFHEIIGSRRKEDRMRFLKNYWAQKLMKIPNVRINTSLKPEWSCGLGSFSIEGMKPGDVSTALFDKYKIHTVSIEWENISGVRITPHVYTRLQDLDRFVNAVEEIAKTNKK